MKVGTITLLGRPSTGKSTLLNTLCKNKVSIVSPIPQTTRRVIRGILTEPRGQILFLDTPGYHQSKKKLNLYLKRAAEETLEETDGILYLLDSTRIPGPEEEEIVKLLVPYKNKLLAVLNKIDDPRSSPEPLKAFLRTNLGEISICPVSALKEEGLENLLTALFNLLPEGELMYPEEYYTDQEPAFRIEEIIREQAILRTKEEVPHALFVEAADLEFSWDGEDLWARVFLIVERDSQKGILVGKEGKMIRAIRVASERECNRIFPYRVKIDLRVKVDPKWKSRDPLLKRITRG